MEKVSDVAALTIENLSLKMEILQQQQQAVLRQAATDCGVPAEGYVYDPGTRTFREKSDA
jgi:aerobic-type carbon monoxide dehydrogenase small subunit (CoxS/CutS family)